MTLTRTLGGRQRPARRAGVAIATVTAALLSGLATVAFITAPPAGAGPTTVVSLQFDDGNASQAIVRSMLSSRGMRATFYVNSGRLGLPGYLTQTQLSDLQADGNEIGGHTVSHADLPTLDLDEAKRQVCNDRVALLNKGFDVTSFAYPYGDFNTATKSVVSECGYNSARTVGGIASPASCFGCPYAEAIPPADPFATRTPDSVKATTTVANLQSMVTNAEANGGGWVQLLMHHICTASPCNDLSISDSTLSEFLDWLALRSANGTVVRTVREVIGGATRPPVSGPDPPAPGTGSNLLKNASLEQSTDGIRPDCWTLGGFGNNVGKFTRTNDAHSGNWAQRVDISNYADGDRKVTVLQDLGSCAPSVIPGHSYVVSNWYKSSVQPRLVAYYRNQSGGWQFWMQAPRAELQSATWKQAIWTTPPVPADATALSVGMSLRAVGNMTVDDFGLADADQTAPTASVTAPADGATVSGTVTISATASDNVAVARVELLVNGAVVATVGASPYETTWNSSTVSDGTVSIAARAVDSAGNVGISPSHLVTVGNNTGSADTTPPAANIACNGQPCTSGWYNAPVQVALTATDDESGVASIRYTTDGSDPITSATAVVYSAPFTVNSSATVRYAATDNDGNVSAVYTQEVRIDSTAPAANIACNGQPCTSGWYRSSVQVALAAADSESDVATVRYTTDGSDPVTSATAVVYSAQFTVDATTTIRYSATDHVGNASVTQSQDIRIDSTPPAVSITSPQNGARVSKTVKITATATDAGAGVAKVTLLVDGATLASVTIPPYQFSWSTNKASKGTHTLMVEAVDGAGNTARSAPVSVTVA